MLAVARPRNRWRVGPWRERLRADLGAVRRWVDAGPVDVYLVGGVGMAAHADAHKQHLPARWPRQRRDLRAAQRVRAQQLPAPVPS